jgi:hypothetical protein
MDNPEKIAGYIRRRKTKQNINTICVGHHYAQTNTIDSCYLGLRDNDLSFNALYHL